MVTVTQKRALGRERTRRYREKLKGDGAIALTRRPSKNAPTEGESYSAWADRTLRLTAGPRRGEPWRCLSWQREPLDMAGRGGRIVVLRAAAQSGKSSVGLALGGARLQLGQPVLIVEPTARPAAVEFARERLEPLLSSKPFAGILHGDRHGGLGRSAAVLYRTATTGGSVSLAGAESPSQLAARGASCLVLDEVARYPLQCGREGSPIALALERTEAWRQTRAVFLVSTPVVPGDPFDEWYSSGDQRHWFVPCAHCGAWWTPTWEHVTPGPPAALVCPSCGVEHADGPDRVALLEAGQWRPTTEADDPEVVSFHLPRWNSPASSLASIVADHQRATRKRSLAVWTRTAAALPCEPDADLPDVAPIQARLEDPDAWPPDGIAFTVAATDVQSNRIETLILGMPADRSWGAVLQYHVTRGRPTEAAVWAALQAIWDDAGVRLGAIDAGYLPQPVKALATRDARCLPIRGMAGAARQPIGAPSGGGWCYTAGSDGLKRDLLGKVDSGWLRLPAAPWCTRTWLLGLTAEHEEVVERSGRRVTAWKQHYQRNEALDCAVYALAICELVPRPRRRRPRLVRV